MKFLERKGAMPVMAFLLGLLSFFFYWWFKEQFTFGNENHCDAWYSFGITNNPIQSVRDFITFYRKDRISSIAPRILFKNLLDPLTSRYFFYCLLHCTSLLALACLGKRIFDSMTTLLLLVIFAFNPLVFGSYQTDYPAMDSVAWSLWALFLGVLSLQTESLSKKKIFTAGVGFFWGLAFFAHFKYGLYAFFIPLLPFMEKTWIPIKKHAMPRFVSFGTGLALSALLLAIISKWGFDGDFFFFREHLIISTMNESDFNRPWQETLGESPMYWVYAFCLALLIAIRRRKSFEPMESAIAIGFLVLLLFILSGGVFFVESNYVWSLLPLLLLLGSWVKNLKLSPKQGLFLVGMVVISLPLVLVVDFKVSIWAFKKLGMGYPLILAFFILTLLTLSSLVKNTALKMPFLILLMAPLFLIRPDHYGGTLFKSLMESRLRRPHYEQILKFYEIMKAHHSPRYPIIFYDGPKNALIEDISSSYIQCGSPYQVSFNHFTDFIKSAMKRDRLIAYVSLAPKSDRFRQYFFENGFDVFPNGEAYLQGEGGPFKILLYKFKKRD